MEQVRGLGERLRRAHLRRRRGGPRPGRQEQRQPAWNNDANWTARIYYNENQNASGPAPYDDFFPGNSRQLNSSVRNNNASLSWWR
ncbi:hypothetical protein [Streptomyces clavuligerus]|uniref:hypothetical protein n=1 Tax=Streptomyces clavuligerus TaxID=1901 RepID=UPI001E3185A7|nr:hypothetical protein [Streptomyces clavuligerus]